MMSACQRPPMRHPQAMSWLVCHIAIRFSETTFSTAPTRLTDSCVLASRQVSRFAKAARKQRVLRRQPGLRNPGSDRVAGRLRDLELHRTLGLLLQHDRPRCHAASVADISDAQLDQGRRLEACCRWLD